MDLDQARELARELVTSEQLDAFFRDKLLKGDNAAILTILAARVVGLTKRWEIDRAEFEEDRKRWAEEDRKLRERQAKLNRKLRQ